MESAPNTTLRFFLRILDDRARGILKCSFTKMLRMVRAIVGEDCLNQDEQD